MISSVVSQAQSLVSSSLRAEQNILKFAYKIQGPFQVVSGSLTHRVSQFISLHWSTQVISLVVLSKILNYLDRKGVSLVSGYLTQRGSRFSSLGWSVSIWCISSVVFFCLRLKLTFFAYGHLKHRLKQFNSLHWSIRLISSIVVDYLLRKSVSFVYNSYNSYKSEQRRTQRDPLVQKLDAWCQEVENEQRVNRKIAQDRILECFDRGFDQLKLSSLNLSSLPDCFEIFSKLRELDVSGNQLRGLPKSLSQLNDLEVLDLSVNKLPELPNWIGQLPSLSKLDVSGNQLTNLPSSILNHSRYIDARNNSFSEETTRSLQEQAQDREVSISFQ